LMTKKQIEEKLSTSAKITYKELKEMYKERDINFSPEKDVTMGIDKVCGDQTADGKPVGLVSFKTYIQSEFAKVAAEYEQNRARNTEMPKTEFYKKMTDAEEK